MQAAHRPQQTEALGAGDSLATVFLRSSKFYQKNAWENMKATPGDELGPQLTARKGAWVRLWHGQPQVPVS